MCMFHKLLALGRRVLCLARQRQQSAASSGGGVLAADAEDCRQPHLSPRCTTARLGLWERLFCCVASAVCTCTVGGFGVNQPTLTFIFGVP